MAAVLEQARGAKHDGSVVLIGRRSLQNRLVARLIDEHLGCACQVKPIYQANGGDIPRGAVALLDVEGMSPREIRMRARAVLASGTYRSIALMNADEGSLDEIALSPGVQGVFFRDSSQEHLLTGLWAMLGGQHWLPSGVPARPERTRPGHGAFHATRVDLTRKERETLYLLVDGHSNSAIALRLGVSPHTVKTHLYNLSLKIGTRNRVQAVKWAIKNLGHRGLA